MFDYRRVLSLEVFRMGPGCFLRREAKRSHQWQDKSAGKFLNNWLFTLGHILHDVYMMWLVEHVWRSQLDVLQIADDEKRHGSRKIPSPSISLIFNNPSMVPNMWLHPLLFTMVNGGDVFFWTGGTEWNRSISPNSKQTRNKRCRRNSTICHLGKLHYLRKVPRKDSCYMGVSNPWGYPQISYWGNPDYFWLSGSKVWM